MGYLYKFDSEYEGYIYFLALAPIEKCGSHFRHFSCKRIMIVFFSKNFKDWCRFPGYVREMDCDLARIREIK